MVFVCQQKTAHACGLVLNFLKEINFVFSRSNKLLAKFSDKDFVGDIPIPIVENYGRPIHSPLGPSSRRLRCQPFIGWLLGLLAYSLSLYNEIDYLRCICPMESRPNDQDMFPFSIHGRFEDSKKIIIINKKKHCTRRTTCKGDH